MNARTTQVYKSACRMYHGGCGVLVHVVDGVVQKVMGDPDSPLNKGRLCPKGAAGIDIVYHPDRLTNPMKRLRARGEGKWAQIGWDEAYDIIANKLQCIIGENGPESIVIGTGTGRHHCNFVPRFANALGIPNWCEPGHAQCFFPRVNVSHLTFGALPVKTHPESSQSARDLQADTPNPTASTDRFLGRCFPGSSGSRGTP